jgi:hypothetical protein
MVSKGWYAPGGRTVWSTSGVLFGFCELASRGAFGELEVYRKVQDLARRVQGGGAMGIGIADPVSGGREPGLSGLGGGGMKGVILR